MAPVASGKAGLKIKYPWQVLEPVAKYLQDKLAALENRKKLVAQTDPFNDPSRVNDNAAVDADAAEQLGHLQVSAVKHALDRSAIQIKKALSRLKIGKYGVCERCGKMIDTDRLVVLPETTVCVACEKKREK